MGLFWNLVKSMRQNSRPLIKTQVKAETPAEIAETAEKKLFEPIPNKEVGEEQKAVKKAKKRKETAVSENDSTTD